MSLVILYVLLASVALGHSAGLELSEEGREDAFITFKEGKTKGRSPLSLKILFHERGDISTNQP